MARFLNVDRQALGCSPVIDTLQCKVDELWRTVNKSPHAVSLGEVPNDLSCPVTFGAREPEEGEVELRCVHGESPR